MLSKKINLRGETMNKNIVVLSSQTYAFKGRELLKRKGIHSKIIRIPSNINISSCGFGLLIPQNIEEAINLLNQHKISVLGVFSSDSK